MRMAAKRKVNGEGTIVQLEKDKPRGKCRKWQLRVSTGRDPKTGKYKTKTRRVCGTYTQAQAGLRAFIAEIEGGEVAVKRTGTTLDAAAADFLARHEAAADLAPGSLAAYRNILKAVCAHLGRAEVSAIAARDVEGMYAAMRAGGTLSGRPAHGAYLNRMHVLLEIVFTGLADEGVIAANPIARMPAPKVDTRERRALPPERMRELVGELDCEDEQECGYFLAATLGLRCGEVCGLSWEDVDFDAGVVSVRRSFDRFGNLKEPKTRAGRRNLPLPPLVAEGLLAHKRAQAGRLSELDPPLALTGASPVIARKRGTRMGSSDLTLRWRADRASFGLDDWCLHELRHSYLSMLAAEGVHPKVMQQLAGHSNSKTTMDIYTHVNMDQKRGAADLVQQALSGPGRPTDPPAAAAAAPPTPAAAATLSATPAAAANAAAASAAPAAASAPGAAGRPAFTVIKCGRAAPRTEAAQAQ